MELLLSITPQSYLPVQRSAGRLDVFREYLDHRGARRRREWSGAGFGRQEAGGRARDAGKLRQYERRQTGHLPLNIIIMMVAPGSAAVYLRFFVHYTQFCGKNTTPPAAQNPTGSPRAMGMLATLLGRFPSTTAVL